VGKTDPCEESWITILSPESILNPRIVRSARAHEFRPAQGSIRARADDRPGHDRSASGGIGRITHHKRRRLTERLGEARGLLAPRSGSPLSRGSPLRGTARSPSGDTLSAGRTAQMHNAQISAGTSQSRRIARRGVMFDVSERRRSTPPRDRRERRTSDERRTTHPIQLHSRSRLTARARDSGDPDSGAVRGSRPKRANAANVKFRSARARYARPSKGREARRNAARRAPYKETRGKRKRREKKLTRAAAESRKEVLSSPPARPSRANDSRYTYILPFSRDRSARIFISMRIPRSIIFRRARGRVL